MDGDEHLGRTPEDLFTDFSARRSGLIKALTTDVEAFYEQCDPSRDNLCLYGLPTGTWEVNEPAEEVPPEIPEPPLGINFARDGMLQKDWLYLVAAHSDSWLLAVAYYFAARFNLDKAARKRLFQMINDLPTVVEVVVEAQKERSTVTNISSSTNEKYVKAEPEESDEDEDEEDDDEDNDTMCGACGEKYAANQFWIYCDVCEKWYHGKCVKITPAKAEDIKKYKCPSCVKKRARPAPV